MNLERLASLVRQLQGALAGAAQAAGAVTGSGGSTYAIAGATANVVSATGTGTGICRIVLDATATSTSMVWPKADVNDNSSHLCSCTVISASPVTFDVYQWRSDTAAAANRSFFFDVKYKPA